MSSSEAQKSAVHGATEDAGSEPSDKREGGGTEASPQPPRPPGSAADDARADEGGAARDSVGTDPDESTYGGPLKLDDAGAT